MYVISSRQAIISLASAMFYSTRFSCCLRQLTLECGYTAASIRERIIGEIRTPSWNPCWGTNLYGGSRQRGTLGGLVGLGEPRTLGRHIAQALEMVRLCAPTRYVRNIIPIVMGSPYTEPPAMPVYLPPETSCERSNKYLDRSLLLPQSSVLILPFFPEPE